VEHATASHWHHACCMNRSACAVPTCWCAGAGQVKKAPKEPKKVVVKLFANEVFTVDDGPPRDIYDPANTAFLNSIKNQEVPAELRTSGAVEIQLSLMQVPKDYDPSDFPKCAAARCKLDCPSSEVVHADASVAHERIRTYSLVLCMCAVLAFALYNASEDALCAAPYATVAALPRRPAFQGTGNRLDGGDGASTSGPAPPMSQPVTTWEGPDESKPMTSIQIRMPDGSRLVGKFNLDQKIHEIRAFVAAARPTDKKAYSMLSGYPLAPIPDESLTIEEGGLKGSVVVFK
jgi:UBX domain/SEP domain